MTSIGLRKATQGLEKKEDIAKASFNYFNVKGLLNRKLRFQRAKHFGFSKEEIDALEAPVFTREERNAFREEANRYELIVKKFEEKIKAVEAEQNRTKTNNKLDKKKTKTLSG